VKKLKLKPKYQQGGASSISVPVYEPVSRDWVSPTIQLGQKQQFTPQLTEPAKPVEVPLPDFSQIEKLAGKGHRNDVDAYIEEKTRLRDMLQARVNLYGPAYAESPEYKMLVQKLLNNPAEINQLLVRFEMSEKNAQINKENGGENEWVTNERGQVLAKLASGKVEFVDRFMVIAGQAKPVSSAEAIQLNDVDPNLTKNNELSPAIAQTLGGRKALEFIDSFIKNIGKNEWSQAIEKFQGVGTVLDGSAILYGETGSERGGSTNKAQLLSLYRSLLAAMPTGVRNYYKNKATERVAGVDITGKSKQELEQLYAQKQQEIEIEYNNTILEHIFKALDISSMSKSTVQYNSNLTKAMAFGAGEEPVEDAKLTNEQALKDIPFLVYDQNSKNYIVNPNSRLGKGNIQKTQTTVIDPTTGEYILAPTAIFPISETTYENIRTAKPGTILDKNSKVIIDGKEFIVPKLIATNTPGSVVEVHIKNKDKGTESKKILQESFIIDKKTLESMQRVGGSKPGLTFSLPDETTGKYKEFGVVEEGWLIGTNINDRALKAGEETGNLKKITPLEAANRMGKQPKDEAEAKTIVEQAGLDPDDLFVISAGKEYGSAYSGQENLTPQQQESSVTAEVGGGVAGYNMNITTPTVEGVRIQNSQPSQKQANAQDKASDALSSLLN